MLFFFDTHDGERGIVDAAGVDLPDEAGAVEQAVALLRDLSHVDVTPGVPRDFSVLVRRGNGGGLYAASLRLEVERLS